MTARGGRRARGAKREKLDDENQPDFEEEENEEVSAVPPGQASDIGDFFLTASDLGVVWHKLLIYGPSGSGKTMGSLMVREDMGVDARTTKLTGASNVAAFILESQAKQAVKLANPQARVRIVSDDEETHGSPTEQLRTFIRLAQSGAFKDAGIDTLVFDGLTEIQQFFRDDILGDAKDDPGASFTWDDWRDLNARMRRLLRTIRTLDYHVICTALSDEIRDEDGKLLKIVPSFEGRKTANQVASFFEAVGFTQRQARRRGTRFVTAWEADAVYQVKSCIPLGGVTPSNAGHWLAVLDGEDAPEEIAKALYVDARPADTEGEES